MLFPELTPGGFYFLQGYLSKAEQEEIQSEVDEVAKEAPFFTPLIPRFGTPFKIEITNCGEYGWVSDKIGYRYQKFHPFTKRAWPNIPERIFKTQRKLTRDLGFESFVPESCLINLYQEGGSLGLHRDDTEKNLSAPIISLSLGASCRFSLGGFNRKDPLESFDVKSGDVIILSGESRLRYHKVENIDGKRYNLTIRQVN